jgi:4-amino-4-deoxy-L-arabinose transferase-like glycosyltransferase
MGTGHHEGWLAKADRRIAEAFSALALSPRAAAAFLIVLCCALYLPGIASLPVTDRDEARFSQASKQMLETGDFVDIRFQDEPRYKKPIGIYWLQSASVSVFTAGEQALNQIWAYRIPSFLGALLAVLATWWAARPIVGRGTALLAGILFASCLTLAFEARIAKSDAALIGFIALSQGALFRLYLAQPGRASAGLAALFWVSLGFGILIKGPIAPAVAFFTFAVVLIADKDRRWLTNLRTMWGLPLMLAITLPWFIAIGISSDGEFFRLSLGDDFITKIKSGQEKHGAPPGYYFILFWWTFWPAALFATGGAAIWLWRNRRLPRALFLLAWIIPLWLVVEATPTKLPHYILPVYPAIAIAAAWILRRKAFGPELPARTYKQAAAVFAFVATLQIAALVGFSWLFEVDAGVGFALAVLALAGLASAASVAAWMKRVNFAATAAVLSAIVFYATAFQSVIPRLDPLWIARNASQAVAQMQACGHGPIAFVGYHEPSTVFINGTNTKLAQPDQAGADLASGAVAFAFVSLRRSASFEDTYRQSTGLEPHRLGCLDGFNLNSGDPLRLMVYASAQTEAMPGCVPAPLLQCRAKEDVRWRRVLDTKF